VVAEPTPLPVIPTPAPQATTTSTATPTLAARKDDAPATTGAPRNQSTTASAIAAAAPAAAPRPPPIELPSSDARYLQNPRPRYPPISLRLREQGTVLVDVLVSEQGTARETKLQSSSGFFRLDNAALSTVRTWRFVPGKRDGVAQSMWFTVPITFQIQ
jgi:protein TonB